MYHVLLYSAIYIQLTIKGRHSWKLIHKPQNQFVSVPSDLTKVEWTINHAHDSWTMSLTIITITQMAYSWTRNQRSKQSSVIKIKRWVLIMLLMPDTVTKLDFSWEIAVPDSFLFIHTSLFFCEYSTLWSLGGDDDDDVHLSNQKAKPFPFIKKFYVSFICPTWLGLGLCKVQRCYNYG